MEEIITTWKMDSEGRPAMVVGVPGADGSVTAVTVIAITFGGKVASARAGNDYLWRATR